MTNPEAARPDPLIDEVRARRKSLLDAGGGTLDGLFQYLRAQRRSRAARTGDCARPANAPSDSVETERKS